MTVTEMTKVSEGNDKNGDLVTRDVSWWLKRSWYLYSAAGLEYRYLWSVDFTYKNVQFGSIIV